MKATFSLCAGALALALAFPASAALPQPKTEHGITYVTGGVGQDESDALKAEAKNYPLSMVFSAGKEGEYLAGIAVQVQDAAGNTLLETKAGPILLIKAPAGQYQIVATREGKTLRRTVTVNGKGHREVSFHWPDA